MRYNVAVKNADYINLILAGLREKSFGDLLHRAGYEKVSLDFPIWNNGVGEEFTITLTRQYRVSKEDLPDHPGYWYTSAQISAQRALRDVICVWEGFDYWARSEDLPGNNQIHAEIFTFSPHAYDPPVR